MAEYIERGLVLETLERAAEHASCIDECTEFSIRQCISTVKKIPAVNVAPAVHGRWIKDNAGVMCCSECGEEHEWEDYRASYCDTCGAKMEEAQ